MVEAADLRVYPDLHPDAFTHDEDRAALAVLRDVPGLDRLLRAISGSTIERAVFANLRHSAIRIGPRQYPSIYRMVERSCRVLDVPVPETWLIGGYTVNASAFGFQSYTIRLYQGLVDLMEPEELQAVIAHEVGHIACEHMLYKSLGALLGEMGGAVMGRLLGPPAELLSGALELAMLRWSRAAEYSCDRAALLVVDDAEVVARTLARLGGSSLRYRDELSLEAALAQDARYSADNSQLDQALLGLAQLGDTHPEPILRAHAIMDWSRSAAFAELRAGRYPTRSSVRERLLRPQIEGMDTCRACGALVPTTRNRCPSCDCHRSAEVQVRCACGAVNDRRWRSCRACGAQLAHLLGPPEGSSS